MKRVLPFVLLLLLVSLTTGCYTIAYLISAKNLNKRQTIEIADDERVFVLGGSTVKAKSADETETIWVYEPGKVRFGDMVLAGDALVVATWAIDGSTSGFTVLNKVTGNEICRKQTRPFHGLSLIDDDFLIGEQHAEDEWYVVRWSMDCEVEWVSSRVFGQCPSVEVIGNRIFASRSDRYWVIDAETGKVRQTARPPRWANRG